MSIYAIIGVLLVICFAVFFFIARDAIRQRREGEALDMEYRAILRSMEQMYEEKE